MNPENVTLTLTPPVATAPVESLTTIMLSKADTSNYNEALNVASFTVTVVKGTQEALVINPSGIITLNPHKIFSVPITVSGGTGDGLITFTEIDNTAIASVTRDGNVFVVKKGTATTGSATFKITKAGGANYNAAELMVTITIGRHRYRLK